MQTTLKLFFLCFFCLSLTLVSGCGGGAPSLTPAEQAEVDKIIAEHGKSAILYYLKETADREEHNRGSMDTNSVLKYLRYFVSKGSDVNAKSDSSFESPLYYAIQTGNVDIVEFLVSKGVEIDYYHAICDAAEMSKVEVFKYLVGVYGANTKNERGFTPLMVASTTRDGHAVEMIAFLVSKGADVNVKDNDGATALHFAKEVEIAQFLVSKGADVNAKANDGRTPLHTSPCYAVRRTGGVEIAQFLVSKGADVNAKDDRGRTPFDEITNETTKHYIRSIGGKSGNE